MAAAYNRQNRAGGKYFRVSVAPVSNAPVRNLRGADVATAPSQTPIVSVETASGRTGARPVARASVGVGEPAHAGRYGRKVPVWAAIHDRASSTVVCMPKRNRDSVR